MLGCLLFPLPTGAQADRLDACSGGGGPAGALAAPRIQRPLPAGVTIIGCMWSWALLLGVLAVVRVPLWLCPAAVVIGFVGPTWNVSVQTYRMRITPNQMLGRTSSVAVQVAWGTIPLGSLLGGVLPQALSPASAMAIVAEGMGLVALATTVTAPIRRAGRDGWVVPDTPGVSGASAASGAPAGSSLAGVP